MAGGQGIDEARVARLESALADVKTIRQRWDAVAANRRVSRNDEAAFAAAYERLQEQSGVVTDDIRTMTGIFAKVLDYGQYQDLFADAILHNHLDSHPWSPVFRVTELRNLEVLLRQTMGIVKAGLPPWRDRTSQAPTMSVHEQARNHLLSRLLERRGQSGYTDPSMLAGSAGRPLDEVADDVRLLRDQGFVTLIEVDNGNIIDVRLTSIGVQRAREGYHAVRGGPQVSQANTFLAPGGTINVAQSGTGNAFLTVKQPGDVAEVSRLLTELAKAIATLELVTAQAGRAEAGSRRRR